MSNIHIKRVSDPTELLVARQKFDPLLDQVERRAYELFEQRGSQHGGDIDDWLDAADQILGTAAVQVTENENEFQITVALPGYVNGEVAITAGAQDIMLQAEAKRPKNGPLVKVMRSFHHCQPVDIERLSAVLRDGVLVITAPKLELARSAAT